MKIKDPVKVIGLFIPLPILSAMAGLWWWMWFWIAVGITLAVGEGLSYKFRGVSLSEQFWAYQNVKMKIFLVVAWLVFAVYLACHLLWRA